MADEPHSVVAALGAGITPPSTKVEIDNWIETYAQVAEWIRFADAKSAVVLTVNGALVGLLVPTLKSYLESTAAHPTGWWLRLVVGLFLGWLAFLALSSVAAFRCILPFRKRGRHPALESCAHFHPAAIGARYLLEKAAEFASDCETLTAAAFCREVQAGLLIDAHISCEKYEHVSRAIRRLALSALFAFLYLVSIQF